MKRRSEILASWLLKTLYLLPVLLLPCAISAQGTAATVSGFVTDETGGKIPAASVTYTNTATGVGTTVTTNSEGLYRIQGLLPGPYKSSVTVTGFKTSVRDGIDLHLEDQVAIDFALSVGAVSESVTVEGTSAVLESSTPTVSQVIEGRQVQDTPLNGRNAMNLIALTPGVVPQGATGGSANNNSNNGAFTNVFGFGNYQIAGGLANQESTYVDGAPVDAFEGHVVSFIPAQDSVQEFRVESSVVNPQYGEFSGGIVSFATKSGTNSIHGTAYNYLRNTIVNANNFFLSGINQPRPKQIQNQFGATIGGPIKKEKAFVFASFESIRTALGVPNLGRVPTAAELQGDFTADPKVINPVPVGNVYSQAKCNGVLNKFCLPGQTSQPGDALYDPTSYYLANTLHYFPLPNTSNAGPAYNYSQTGKAFSTLNTYDLRADFSVGAKQKIFAKYGRLDGYQQGTQFVFNNPTGPNSGAAVGRTVSNYVFGDTITTSPTGVVDLRISYLRYFSFFTPTTTNLSAISPFYAGIANQVLAPVFPNVSITNNVAQPYGQLASFSYQPINQYAISGTYSKLLGRHSLSFGGEIRERDEYYVNLGNSAGNFVFGGTNTACVPSATKVCGAVVAPGSGATPVADFVSGRFTSAGAGFPNATRPSTVNHYGGIFLNDTFQLSPRFTLTAGLRYELPGGFVEKRDNNAVILPQLANPLVLVNSSAYASRSDLVSHLKLFSPRVGFSFQPYAGTTVRAGYSLAYLPQEIVFAAAPAGSSVNSPTTFIAAGGSISVPLGFLPGTTTPKTTILTPIGGGYATNPTYLYGQTIAGRNPNYSFPYLQQWNGNVQQAFGASTIMQIAYLGARGQHLAIANTYDINQLPDNATLASANRPYPQYQNVNVNSAWIGDSYYHSLQATLTKRFHSGGTVLANYSWSKFLGTADSLNPQVETHAAGGIQNYNNPRAERSYTSFDVPHRLVVSYILDLPVGKGKRFLGNADGVVNGLVSGWNASGINTFQSGFPLAITTTASVISSAYGGGATRPNYVLGCNKKIDIGYVAAAQQQKPILNSACFTSPGPAAGTVPIAANYFGNQPRTDGSIRTQGIDNWDFAIGKTTPIRESVNLVFRAEAFNVTNRVQFGDPSLSAAAASFGLLTTQSNQPRSFQFSLRVNY